MLGTDGQASSTGFVFCGPEKWRTEAETANRSQHNRVTNTSGRGGEEGVKYHGSMRGRYDTNHCNSCTPPTHPGLRHGQQFPTLFSLAANCTTPAHAQANLELLLGSAVARVRLYHRQQIRLRIF